MCGGGRIVSPGGEIMRDTIFVSPGFFLNYFNQSSEWYFDFHYHLMFHSISKCLCVSRFPIIANVVGAAAHSTRCRALDQKTKTSWGAIQFSIVFLVPFSLLSASFSRMLSDLWPVQLFFFFPVVYTHTHTHVCVYRKKMDIDSFWNTFCFLRLFFFCLWQKLWMKKKSNGSLSLFRVLFFSFNPPPKVTTWGSLKIHSFDRVCCLLSFPFSVRIYMYWSNFNSDL
jgi:hypothetical protein